MLIPVTFVARKPARLLLIAALAVLLSACFSSSSDSGDDDDGDGPPDNEVAIPPTRAGDIRFNEVMADPGATAQTLGEWFEVRNPTTTLYTLRDCVFSDAAGSNFSVGTDLEIGAGELRTFAVSPTPGFIPDYNYQGSGLTLNDTGDTLTLTCSGIAIDVRTYAAAAVADGRSSSLSANGNGKWCLDLANIYNLGDRGTPGGRNVDCA